IETRLIFRVIALVSVYGKMLVRYSINYELVKMAVCPAHYDLKNSMELVQRDVVRNEYPPPYGRSDAPERYLELIDSFLTGFILQRHFSLPASNEGVCRLARRFAYTSLYPACFQASTPPLRTLELL